MQVTKQKIAVYGLILNKNNEILVLQRAPHDTHPNVWELPGGGVMLGEHPEKAVTREVLEESGLAINPVYPIAVLNGSSSRDESTQVIRIAFYCHLSRDDQTISLSTEHTNYQWIPSNQLPELEFSDIFEDVYKKIQDYPQLLLIGKN